MNIEILISTYNDGIKNIDDVCRIQDIRVRYLIVHQVTSDQKYEYSHLDKRNDIKIIIAKERGVTKSRNIAIKHASSEICLFSDDDVAYKKEYIENILKYFEKYKETDVCIFKIETPEGEPEYDEYKSYTFKLKESIGVGTIQIAFRLKSIRRENIYFDERFGAGNDMLIGADEKIFIHDCIKKNVNVYYYPVYIVEHPFDSTQKKLHKYDPKNARLAGGVDARIRGAISIARTLGSFIRHYKKIKKEKRKPFVYIYNRIYSAIYVLLTNKKYAKYIPEHIIKIQKEYE